MFESLPNIVIFVVFVYLFPYFMYVFKEHSHNVGIRKQLLQWILVGILFSTGSLPSSFNDNMYWIGYLVLNICVVPLLFFANYKLIQNNHTKQQGNS